MLVLSQKTQNAIGILRRNRMVYLSRGGGEIVWCNPPYGREIYKWVEKGYRSAENEGAIVVMLLPARTDTKWFHEFCYMNRLSTVRFVRGRLKFGGSKNSAPFPSMVVIFRK